MFPSCPDCEHSLSLSRKVKGQWQCTYWNPNRTPAPECHCTHAEHAEFKGAFHGAF